MFSRGDLVKLKSGGTVMTVRSESFDNGKTQCASGEPSERVISFRHA